MGHLLYMGLVRAVAVLFPWSPPTFSLYPDPATTVHPWESPETLSPGTFLIHIRDAGEECPRPPGIQSLGQAAPVSIPRPFRESFPRTMASNVFLPSGASPNPSISAVSPA